MGGKNRLFRPGNCLRFESLEGRRLLTGVTQAQAVVELKADAASVAAQFTKTETDVKAAQAGLMYVVRQLDSDNFQRLTADTNAGNVQAALVDLTDRNLITAAEKRINAEFTPILATLTTADKTFVSANAALIGQVQKATVTPAAGVATGAQQVTTFQAAATTAETQSSTTYLNELPNVASLTNTVEGLAATNPLGTFHGPFDIKTAVSNTQTLDQKGLATVQLGETAHLLQGFVSPGSSDFLETISTAGGTSTLVKQPLLGGTILATVGQQADSLGFTVHGTVELQLGANGTQPATTVTFQIQATLTAQRFLVGNVLLGGKVVGTLNWGLVRA